MQDDPNLSQRVFASALLDPELPIPTGVKDRAVKRYSVYRNNVTVSLVRAMESNFPAIRKLLGDIYFTGLAREFVKHAPPQSPLLFAYGDKFADYLATQTDLQNYPYLPDVARIEQQWRLAYHELDAPCLTPEALAGLNDEQISELRLTPHPALSLIASNYAALSIFQTNRESTCEIEVDFAKSEYVVISRPHYEVQTQKVSESTYVFIKSLKEGHTFGAAADAAFIVDEDLNLSDCIATVLVSGAFQPLNSQQ